MNLKFPITEEEIQRYLAAKADELAYKPVKSRHAVVTIGSKTERGGEVVTASTEIEIMVNGEKLKVARVGDTITSSTQDAMRITQFADEPPISGLLQPDYVAQHIPKAVQP